MKIKIEGWRFLPYSYAIANQFQLLEMLKRSDLEIRHQDIPYSQPEWQAIAGLFSPQIEARLNQIPKDFGSETDVTLRMYKPYHLSSSSSRKTLVLATAPWGILIDQFPQLQGLFHLKNYSIPPDVTVITPSRWSQEGLIRSGIDAKQIAVVPWGVDLEIYHPLNLTEKTALRQKFGWDNYFIFLHVGSLQDQDGIRPILRAFAQVIECYPDARLVLKGSNELYQSNQWLIQASQSVLTSEQAEKIRPRVAYIGQPLSCQELAQLYQAADAYISIDVAAAYNLSALEAMATGLPIICTSGSVTEEITHPDFTLKIDSGFKTKIIQNQSRFFLHPNWEQLAIFMQEVMQNNKWCKTARQVAPQFIAKHYTWKHTVDRLLEVAQSSSMSSQSILNVPYNSSEPRSLIVEGWRDIPHSYALINSYQLLELIKHPELKLFHQDMPYVTDDWKPNKQLLSLEADALLEQISTPEPNQKADVTLRMYCPFNLTNSASSKTVVFGCTEWGMLPRTILNGMKIHCFREAHRNSDTIIVTSSHWSREGFIRSGAVPERVVVVPLGIDPNIYHPLPPEQRQELRKKMGLENCFVFLNIGVMWNERQGVDRLLKAFAKISEIYPEARLILKGRDAIFPSKEYIRQVTKNLLTEAEAQQIKSRIRYIGESLSAQEMAQLYQIADAYVSPYAAEGFNLPVLEAIATGVPVICTQGGPTDDFTTSEVAYWIQSKLTTMTTQQTGETRFLLEPNQDHLIELMKTVIETQDKLPQFQTIGPKFVAEKLTWKRVVNQLIQVLFE